MEKYYNAGYYLIKKQPLTYGKSLGKMIYTCSNCININAFDTWALSWVNGMDEEKKKALQLDENTMQKIYTWTDEKFDKGLIDFGGVLPSLEMAYEFKELFYKGRSDIEILTLEFSETETDNIIADFAPNKNIDKFNYNNGRVGLSNNLLKKNKQTDNSISKFLGFDFIGVECDSSFHSFYCHDITKELIDMFDLQLNEYGLFENIPDCNLVRAYLNDEKSGLEPVPWYIVKVKKINDASFR